MQKTYIVYMVTYTVHSKIFGSYYFLWVIKHPCNQVAPYTATGNYLGELGGPSIAPTIGEILLSEQNPHAPLHHLAVFLWFLQL